MFMGARPLYPLTTMLLCMRHFVINYYYAFILKLLFIFGALLTNRLYYLVLHLQLNTLY